MHIHGAQTGLAQCNSLIDILGLRKKKTHNISYETGQLDLLKKGTTFYKRGIVVILTPRLIHNSWHCTQQQTELARGNTPIPSATDTYLEDLTCVLLFY